MTDEGQFFTSFSAAGESRARLFMLDNYDSFTFNLVQYFTELGAVVDVARNDTVSPETVLKEGYDGVVISPGPGVPEDAGITKALIQAASGVLPLLGVCLGHQALGEVFGAKVVRADRLMHGKTSPIHHDESELFSGLKNPFDATRYHSLILKPDTIAKPLQVLAQTDQDEIMAIRHRSHPSWGVQFHPESVLTDLGKPLLENFLKHCGTKIATADEL